MTTTLDAGRVRRAQTTARYTALVRLCRGAFDAGQYDAAYHALAAALHSAQDLQDGKRLEAVGALAAAQLEHIDARAPEYHHSTQSAQGRGNASLLGNLTKQAHGQVLVLRARPKTPG